MRKLFLLLSVLFVVSCSKDDVCDTTPNLSTPSITEASYSSIKISGSVKGKECDLGVISKGIVISKDELPTINTAIIRRNISNNSFDITIENLETKTQYYIRTFLINNEGEFYSSQTSFTSLNENITFSDIEAKNINFSSVTLKGNFQFAEGNGYEIKSKGIVLSNTENEDLISNGNSIEISIDDLDHNSDYNYYLYVDTNYGKFKSELNSFKTVSANSIFGDIKVSDLTYRAGKISVEYETEYDTDEITTEKGIEVCRDNDCKKFISNEAEKIISIEIDTLRSNTTYRVSPYIQNEYSYQSVRKEFTTLESPYKVGQEDEGGMITWIDYTGWRGIVTAPKQVYKKLQWTDKLDSSNNLFLDWRIKLGMKITGYDHTKKIVNHYSNLAASAPAAEYAYNLTFNGFEDWYLPSFFEFKTGMREYLKRFYDSGSNYYDADSDYFITDLNNPGKTNDAYTRFWTSSTDAELTNQAFSVQAYTGNDSAVSRKKDKSYWVLPIRRFNY